MKKVLKSKKALSPVVAAIILIAVTVAVAIAVAAWMGALNIGFMDSNTKIEIDPQIYSANYNFGVLNEDAIFDISIENCVNKSRVFNVIVSVGEHETFNETIEIMGLATKNLKINQKLLFSGLWTIAIFEENKIVDGYSFVTLANNAEANLKITQMDNIKINRILSIIAILVSLIIPIYSVSKYLYSKYQAKKNKKAELKPERD